MQGSKQRRKQARNSRQIQEGRGTGTGRKAQAKGTTVTFLAYEPDFFMWRVASPKFIEGQSPIVFLDTSTWVSLAPILTPVRRSPHEVQLALIFNSVDCCPRRFPGFWYVLHNLSVWLPEWFQIGLPVRLQKA
jgi:hypothetical protein